MAADESPRRLLIIVFDTINTAFLQQARAREELIDFLKESVAQIRKSGLAYRHYLELAPGNYTVKFVVRDNASGRMGTVSAPLAVQ